NNYDLDAEYSPAVATAPHRLVLTGMYQLPFGNGRRFLTSGGLMDALFGGWQVTAFGTYQSGFPLSISQNNNNAGTFGGGQRPNLVDGVDPETSGSDLDRIGGGVDNPAVSPPAPVTPRGPPRTLHPRGPPITKWGLWVRKAVGLGGGATGMMRFELINALNITGLRSPDISFGRVTFGRITAQAGFTRVLQLTLRVGW